MTKALDRLLDLLDLEQIEVNIFRGRSPDERRQRVFGGRLTRPAEWPRSAPMGLSRLIRT